MPQNLDHDIMLIEWAILQHEKGLPVQDIKIKYLQIQRDIINEKEGIKQKG